MTPGENSDGAYPYARLTLGHDGTLYSTASDGGAERQRCHLPHPADGDFKVLHTFSATNPTPSGYRGYNEDGAIPDYGVVLDEDNNSLIGIADYGGNGSTAGFFYSGGTLYRAEIARLGPLSRGAIPSRRSRAIAPREASGGPH